MPGPVVIAKLVAKPGQGDDLVKVMTSVVDAVASSEDETDVYACHRSIDDPDVVWFYERYRDDAAAEVHRTGEALRSAGPRIAPLLAGRPEIIRCQIVHEK
jgi:quinol monooxygenase YgiN